MGTAKDKSSIYHLKITLVGINRPIWRRVQVPSTIRLGRLHDVFQAAMGWTDSHLHQFEKDGKYWAVPDPDELEGDIRIIDESRVSLASVLTAEGDSMIYVYDFGDDWRHEVVLEKILPSDSDASARPICLAGERRCPPEDVGGPSGYLEFLEVIFEPGHEEFARLRGWAGGTFHAEEFNAAAVNRVLGRMRWPVRNK
ncbi:MAG TPA: plasmid pRiA4b ORF-3 family protein [Bryobacteraceae bacterium]|nr:plasmid pRiA4b ORF-3 family protein [Bryobacteraceae bacterium]